MSRTTSRDGTGDMDGNRRAAALPVRPALGRALTAATIRPARPNELEALRALERDAGRAFAAIGMAEIARDEPAPVAELEAFRAAGRAWVAVDAADGPVAYLLAA